MKEFKVRSGNFLKSSNSTSNMMYTILVVLIPFIIFSTYKNGIYPIIKGYGNLYLVFKPLIFASVASLFCLWFNGEDFTNPDTMQNKTLSFDLYATGKNATLNG